MLLKYKEREIEIIRMNNVIIDYARLGEEGGEVMGEISRNRRHQLHLQESTPKSLTIEVLSSQSRVAITVDGATVRSITLNLFYT